MVRAPDAAVDRRAGDRRRYDAGTDDAELAVGREVRRQEVARRVARAAAGDRVLVVERREDRALAWLPHGAVHLPRVAGLGPEVRPHAELAVRGDREPRVDVLALARGDVLDLPRHALVLGRVQLQHLDV